MNQFTRTDTSRVIKAPTGTALTCKKAGLAKPLTA